jgi:2-polyprenyl-6-methoxyphenol hydroxylase-like FAD-dependent oxidoreductase
MHSKAIVIGSGMGGLAAAQVLSRHFEQVVVVERDRPQPLMHWSALDAAIMQEGARPGVKQVSHGSMHACNQGLHGGPASSSTAVGPSAAVATAAVLSQRVLHNLVQQLMRDLDSIMHSNIRCMCKCQAVGRAVHTARDGAGH